VNIPGKNPEEFIPPDKSIAYLLEVEPLDLGADVKAVGIELVEDDENREPVRGKEAARIWSRVLWAASGKDHWVLDFFSHLDRLKQYCLNHKIAFREAAQRCIVIPTPEIEQLENLIDRFQKETFGARAGGPVETGDAPLEGDLSKRGVDAYHNVFANYFFCAVCNFDDGSLVLLSQKLWASEVIRRVRPVLEGFAVEVRLPT
jgi:hypothetical protein